MTPAQVKKLHFRCSQVQAILTKAQKFPLAGTGKFPGYVSVDVMDKDTLAKLVLYAQGTKRIRVAVLKLSPFLCSLVVVTSRGKWRTILSTESDQSYPMNWKRIGVVQW